MSFFYEIRSADNIVLKRDGGFVSQDAAKMAAREDVKKMKNSRQPDRPDIEASALAATLAEFASPFV